MDKKHTQTLLSYCAELSRYATLIEKELTDPSQEPNDIQNRETNNEKIGKSEAFFTYSVMLPNIEEEEDEVLIVGNFIIKNTGNEALHAPVICIRIAPASAGKLGGKIRSGKVRSIQQQQPFIEAANAEEWEYVHEDGREASKKTNEYWLKPTFCSEVAAGSSLMFSNFTLTLSKPKERKSIIVEGFAYFKEQSEGISSLNNIIINF